MERLEEGRNSYPRRGSNSRQKSGQGPDRHALILTFAQLETSPRMEWAVDEKVIEQLWASVGEDSQITTRWAQVIRRSIYARFACGHWRRPNLRAWYLLYLLRESTHEGV